MALYILYDTRGILSPEEANVLDTFSAKNDKAAIKKAEEYWGEYSWALYEGDYLIAWKTWKRKRGKRISIYWDKFQT